MIKSVDRPFRRRCAFTLVELLVVIAIIGVLVSLLLPAVQSARETARRAQCMNNLKQIGISVLLHEQTHKHLPTGGWGWNWAGDPDRGFGKQQPGGWIYNILPFIEEGALRNLGAGLSGADQRAALTQLCQQPIAAFNCPSRRAPGLFPVSFENFSGRLRNTDKLEYVARADYAINGGGDGRFDQNREGPASFALADKFPWPDTSTFSGVSFMRSTVRLSQVSDGTTKTYLVGEKMIEAASYDSNDPKGDNLPMYVGEDFDTTRYTGAENKIDNPGDGFPPEQDRVGFSNHLLFGSPHPGNMNMLLCDGSVAAVSYDVDERVHLWMGMRNDGQVLDERD